MPFRRKHSNFGRVAACGDRCPRRKVALESAEPLLDHEHGGLSGAGTEPVQGFLGLQVHLGRDTAIHILDRDRRLLTQIPPQVATPNCGSFLKQA